MRLQETSSTEPDRRVTEIISLHTVLNCKQLKGLHKEVVIYTFELEIDNV